MSVGLANKRARIIILSVAAVLLIGGGVWAIAAWNSQNNDKDPYISVDVEQVPEEVEEEEKPAEIPAQEEEPATTVDPATVSTVDIEPLGITVSYVRGVPGFEYAVSRTQSQVQYVSFSSPELIGTKCSGDTGVFATIMKNPSEGDKATISQTKELGEDAYGLSLPAATCTSNSELLTQFQTSFKDAFGLLKTLSEAPAED